MLLAADEIVGALTNYLVAAPTWDIYVEEDVAFTRRSAIFFVVVAIDGAFDATVMFVVGLQVFVAVRT